MPKEFLDQQGLQTLVNELETNIVAEEYSSSATYAIGDYCIYNNLFYRCTTATTGAWDSTAWVQVIISDEIPTIHSITTAQWEALTPAQKASGDYVITDATTVPLTAENVPYDDTVSGLTADNVQDAIDELSQSSGASSVAQLEDVQLSNLSDNDLLVYDSNLTGGKLWKNAKKIVTCTQAEFDVWVANNSFPYTDCKYIITDSNNLTMTSADIPYDSTGTDSVKDVLDLLLDRIYPVGSIYMSVTDSTVASVEARFGGTWERISEGKALFGYSSTDADFQTIGSGGGNKTVNLQHTHGFASNAVVGSTTLTGRQSGIQQHKHSVASNAEYEVSNNGKITDGITGGGHTHNFNTYIQNAADEAHGYTLVGGGGFYDRCVVTSSINRIYATSNTHKHDLPNHSHTVSLKSGKGLTLNNTGHTNALDSHNHSLSSVNTGNGLSTTQNILNPYITVYMYKRTA